MQRNYYNEQQQPGGYLSFFIEIPLFDPPMSFLLSLSLSVLFRKITKSYKVKESRSQIGGQARIFRNSGLGPRDERSDIEIPHSASRVTHNDDI
ncbi:hypothetical protein GWI33_005623 [Rhynchophorus ferrugineus]|uniref:Uncharacterized protein n=1 Tax=Rhynchophorus ferrugineus TaxID=354439 RepID=A0A834IJP8_RHYFE|nr:hypothetical protein GWI33_005623 [Rhynchophorus ferrugineus]